MTNRVHRIVQDSAHYYQWPAAAFTDSKHDEVASAAAIAADVEGIRTRRDLRPSAYTENLRSLTQGLQSHIDEA